MPLKRLRHRAGTFCLAGLLALAAPLGQAQALEISLSAPNASEDLAERLRGASSVLSARARGFDTVQELLAASLSDYRTLVQVLYDAGHFGPSVSIRLNGREAALIPPLNPPASISTIDIRVEPGPAFRFGTARIAPVPQSTDLPSTFATGAPASTAVLQATTRTAREAWRDAGHAKVRIAAQKITANHRNAQLNADIRMAPGPKLRFGTLHIAGQSDVRPDAIQRIAGFPSGETFDPQDVQTVGTRLRRTGTFTSVALSEAENANPDGTLDYTATFEDQPKRHLSFGIELQSNEGIDLSAKWMHRNLFGGAERLRIETRLANIGGSGDLDGRVAVRLDRPATFGPDSSSFYLFEIESLDEPHYTARRAMLGLGVRRVFSETLNAEWSLVGATTRADDAFGTGRRFDYLLLPLRIEQDRRDSKVSATQGTYLNAQIVPFAGFKGSKSGLYLKADGRAYRPLGSSNRIVAAGRLQLGSALGPGLQDIAPGLLFFSGGAGSVRGQPYQSLGIPVGGSTAGGRSFLAASAELRGYVTDKISLVGFYDVGMVDSDSFVSGSSSRHAGAGIGLRYDLGGLGPLRLDLAQPVSGSTGNGLQFYLGIGQAF